MTPSDAAFEPVYVEGDVREATLLFVCEHASADFPARFGDLGISEATRNSHAAWDLGALETARAMAAHFSAPLVRGGVSRLLYDCNRPPEAPDAIPKTSEIHPIPGNADLSADARAERIERIYRPFRAALSRTIDQVRPSVLVTVHSFTPVYFGQRRDVEIGLLHDRDARLADAMLAKGAPLDFNVRRNEPYGPGDGVMHTLCEHAESRGLLNVMIEIRNDLITESGAVMRVAGALAGMLEAALDACAIADRKAS